MKIYFLTYGDQKFYISKKHLISLAKKSELFAGFAGCYPVELTRLGKWTRRSG